MIKLCVDTLVPVIGTQENIKWVSRIYSYNLYLCMYSHLILNKSPELYIGALPLCRPRGQDLCDRKNFKKWNLRKFSV